MVINKRDRVALLVTVTALIIAIIAYILEVPILFVAIFLLPFYCYWGERFIKNDISFLNIKED